MWARTPFNVTDARDLLIRTTNCAQYALVKRSLVLSSCAQDVTLLMSHRATIMYYIGF